MKNKQPITHAIEIPQARIDAAQLRLKMMEYIQQHATQEDLDNHMGNRNPKVHIESVIYADWSDESILDFYKTLTNPGRQSGFAKANLLLDIKMKEQELDELKGHFEEFQMKFRALADEIKDMKKKLEVDHG